ANFLASCVQTVRMSVIGGEPIAKWEWSNTPRAPRHQSVRRAAVHKCNSGSAMACAPCLEEDGCGFAGSVRGRLLARLGRAVADHALTRCNLCCEFARSTYAASAAQRFWRA